MDSRHINEISLCPAQNPKWDKAVYFIRIYCWSNTKIVISYI